MRRTLGLVLAGLLLPLAPATAKPAPACARLLTDASGDAYLPELDVVAADVRSDRKGVAITLWVAGPLGTNTLPGSKEWRLSWVLGPKAYDVRRRADLRVDGGYNVHYVFSNGYQSQDFAASAVRVTATSIQWTVPRAWLPGLKSPKSRTFLDVAVSTSSYGYRLDAARTSRIYVDGATCSVEGPRR